MYFAYSLLKSTTLNRLTCLGTVVRCLALLVVLIVAVSPITAQPASGANKFLGNITTRGKVRSDFAKYWNQITGENESKWESVERSRDKMNWDGVDSIANYAKRNNIPWKFHTLIWGSQYPSWLTSLSQADQLAEITEWMDEAAKRYPDVEMIDVINEAFEANGGKHVPPPFKNALGGTGSTGFDWMIKAFEMAHERWPKAILIYNDYNTIEYNNEVNWQVKMATAMKTANAPMHAIGVQAHDAWKIATATVKSNIDKLAATGYPIIVSEYDIGQSNDAAQKKVMEEQFTMFWNHPKVIGITYWGYVVGSTWRNGTGLLNTNGTERPALTWLVDFVKQNQNPPNDYPNLLAESNNGTSIQRNNPVPLTLSNTFFHENRRRIKVYDLQGRITGVFYNNIQASPAARMRSSQGMYVITVDNHYTGVFNKKGGTTEKNYINFRKP
jgi:endo-1,4-beta-xylanase